MARGELYTPADQAAEFLRRPRRDRLAVRRAYVDAFDAEWRSWSDEDGDEFPRDRGWDGSVARFHELGLELDRLLLLTDTAMRSRASARGKWRYLMGCCWNVLDGKRA